MDGVGSASGAIDNCREGAGLSIPTSNGAARAFERELEGTQDTDDNVADFDGPQAADPQNLASDPSADQAPAVTARTPASDAADVAFDSNVSLTFSEDVSTAGEWFSIECTVSGAHQAAATGGPRTYMLDPATDFAPNETCTVTVSAANVTDTDENDPPNAMAQDDSWSFTTIAPTYRIHEIQGSGHLSALAGQRTSFVPGVVTALGSNGFWMQDPEPDSDPGTSEGIFVFTSSAPTVDAGQSVTVSGRVTEFRPGGANTDNLTTTELDRATVYPGADGADIDPTVVGEGGRVPPNSVIENDALESVESSGVFDFEQDGIDFYESLEGMKLQVNDAVVVGPTNNFGEVFVVADGGANAGVRTSRGGVVISPGDFNPERLQFDPALADIPDVDVGDRFPGATVGVLGYNFANFELLPLEDVTAESGGLEPETTVAPRRGELSVATFNVENLDPSDGETMPRLASLVVENMRAPDLIAIEEMQDNNGGTNDSITAADESWEAFIAAIDAIEGAPEYDYRQIDPVDDADGGQPGGNIRVGFLFRTDRGLRFVDRGEGDAITPTGVFKSQGRAHLTLSPGRVDPTNAAWVATRKPLAGEFTWKGATLIAIANHFSSKGGDDPLFGRWQPPVRSTEVARHRQAASVNAFVDDILAAEKDANVVVLGDINDFEFSETTEILEGGVLSSLLHQLPKPERYSYVFEGNSQVLDQILASEGALKALRGFDAVHVNAEFADQASDHDPSVARFELKERAD